MTQGKLIAVANLDHVAIRVVEEDLSDCDFSFNCALGDKLNLMRLQLRLNRIKVISLGMDVRARKMYVNGRSHATSSPLDLMKSVPAIPES